MTEADDEPVQDTTGDPDIGRIGLTRATRLNSAHWAVISASVLITLVAWQLTTRTMDERSDAHFQRHADRAVQLLQERLQHYESILWAGTAALQNPDVPLSVDQWHDHARYLNVVERFPGTHGIGVILQVKRAERDRFLAEQRKTRPDYTIHPPHEREVLLPIVFVEPTLGNQEAIGLDVAFEEHRWQAAMAAKRLGTAQISGPITLVQDDRQRPGFLFYAPFYQKNRHLSLQQREDNLTGFVYAPLVVQNLVEGTIATKDDDVSIRISDQGVILYDEHDSSTDEPIHTSDFHAQRTLNVYGREWTFDIANTPTFHHDAGHLIPNYVLGAGLIIDSLLLALFLTISRMNRKALSSAHRSNEQLLANTAHLKDVNEQLSSFAYVVSHDLRTPLRGIHDLVSFLEEDLQPYLSSGQADQQISRNIDRLYRQVHRSNSLIDGILDYSGIEAKETSIDIVDTAEIIREIGRTLGIRGEQLIARGVMPVFETHAVELRQVLSNLVDNAFKYHHDRENGLTVITVTEETDHYHFAVADNGPGIERQYFTRIFEPFKTLQRKDEIESNGIGLSIVKRLVERVGGSIKVQSLVGTGTVFTIAWPKSAPGVIHIQRAA